jgi:hypothetical protein
MVLKECASHAQQTIVSQSDYKAGHPHFLAETSKSLDEVVGHT